MLADYVYTNQLRNKITSTLLLDVKGAYNHVSKNRLLIILKDLAFPNSVIVDYIIISTKYGLNLIRLTSCVDL
ncbi:hypothetical protein LHYA1_G009160 [Lachnellula hyalina]|uniref:Reverse transcriptase domain-containing protein n=1 Tax=Lachnellula hyalina TaxID=1316788 RepID=A0A8H8QT96_9HELO|nr:uncharacterized protein LHYA1_G009160 [Lachnellula hyalina]TVY22141.1 hypothetical protein LHYA1_G009160 [Lachnellula hyalina]